MIRHKPPPAKGFEKGNIGRPKGSKNHSSRIREDFFEIWRKVDGKTKLAEYVSNNPKALFQFAELIVRLLPPDQRDPIAVGPAPRFVFYINGQSRDVSATELASGRPSILSGLVDGQNGGNGAETGKATSEEPH